MSVPLKEGARGTDPESSAPAASQLSIETQVIGPHPASEFLAEEHHSAAPMHKLNRQQKEKMRQLISFTGVSESDAVQLLSMTGWQ